jgi:predicted RNase H-like HicB family nuclease
MKIAKSTTIRVTLRQEVDGTYWAESPDAVGCFTVGTTIDETLANMKNAVRTHFELPVQSPIHIEPTVSAKLTLS